MSLRVETTRPHSPDPRSGAVGVNVGIGDTLLIVMRPDGTVVEKVPNPRALRSCLHELKLANRALARKAEGSPRWRKAKTRLGRVHTRIAAIRSDAVHKATTRLAKTHGQIVIEELAPGQHARGLRSHRKSWVDACTGELRRQLGYKTDWYQSELWVADRRFPSSQLCSTPGCDCRKYDLTMSDREWDCPTCGMHHDRDENAGTNLAKLPASWAEAQSDSQTAPGLHVAVKRVNLPGREAA